MRRNTELVESVVGYPYAELRDRLRRAGALASGVSGMGPALASIAEASDAIRVLEAMPADAGERRIVAFVPPDQGGDSE
jgi:shikimate kinase